MSSQEVSAAKNIQHTGGVISFSIKEWDVWAPGVEDKAAWQQWANGEKEIEKDGEPAVKFLAPMFRRRLSCLSKMALTVAYGCMGERKNIPVIFCSRRGEDATTLGLLKAIIAKEPVSPTGFSLAVHNAASGSYTIDRGDTAPVTALAAGANSFCTGLLDALASLARSPSGEVMYVYYDEPLLDIYQPYADNDNAKIAVALLLSNKQPGFSLSFSNHLDNVDAEPQVMLFLRFLLSAQTRATICSPRLRWELARIL